MNKPKYQITNRAKKKMNKEVRSSSIEKSPKVMSTTKAQAVLSSYPKNVRKKETASLKSLAKNLSAKQQKSKSPHSKRTSPGSPGTAEREAAPKIVHLEGKRWIKSTESKIQADKKINRRRSLKKK